MDLSTIPRHELQLFALVFVLAIALIFAIARARYWRALAEEREKASRYWHEKSWKARIER